MPEKQQKSTSEDKKGHLWYFAKESEGEEKASGDEEKAKSGEPEKAAGFCD